MPELTGPDPSIFAQRRIDAADILKLDVLAAAAWPAPESEDLDGWRLRYGEGVSRRANSCAPFPPSADARPLDARIAEVEAFYRRHGQPPRFQISPAAAPDGLEDELVRRGYDAEAPVTIQIAPAEQIAAADADLDPTDSDVRVETDGGDVWWALYLEGFERDASDIVAGADEVPAFASAGRDDEKDAIGLGVLGGRWLGIYGMFTRPAVRRHGLGRRLLAALARWAIARGADGVYLQVEDHNDDARRLYERLGFRSVYGYHYRTLWT